MSFKEGQLLAVATSLQVSIPDLPDWYRDEYFAATKFDADKASEIEIKKATMQATTAWQTHFLQLRALSLIEVCEKYDAAQTQALKVAHSG